VLSKWRFAGSDTFFALLLIGCFIPFQVMLLPMARTLGALGISQSLSGLMLVHIGLRPGLHHAVLPQLLRRRTRRARQGRQDRRRRLLPDLLRKSCCPSAPIFVVSMIWQTTQIWNDFLFGVVFSTGENQPITVALNNLVNTSTG
jgi:glucose/mannose transport system permease protein